MALATKSGNSLKCAKLLITNSLYTNSIHCSYYAIFQYIIFLCNKLDINIDEFKGGGSHNKRIKCLINNIFTTDTKVELKDWLSDTIFKIKALRVKADYENYDFNDQEALKVFDLANQVITILKQKT